MDSNHAPAPLSASQEADLIAAAQAGDCDAFLALVRHYQRPLYRLAYATCATGTEAATLTQEAFAQAWKHLTDYPSGRRFYPWLIRMVRSSIIDAPPSGVILEQDEPLRAAFHTLRPDDRMALALKIVERMPSSEIAALLDVPTGLVTLRIAQARSAILAHARQHEERIL